MSNENNAEFEIIQQQPSCKDRLLKLKQSPFQDQLKEYWNALPFIVSEAKVTPVIYLRHPAKSTDPKASAERSLLERQLHVRNAIRNLLNNHKNNKNFLRKIFLPEGYLFHDNPEIAAAMSQEIRLGDLFDEKIIYSQTNNQIQPFLRNGGNYFDQTGNEASLYLNDRISITRQELENPAHLDISFVVHTIGAIRVLPQTIDFSSAWIQIVFPSGNRYNALISLEKETTVISCIDGDSMTINKEKRQAMLFYERHSRIIKTAKSLVKERPIFDEPKDEADDVQEDGELRPAWKEAYFNKKRKFLYHSIEYDIFDKEGQPIPPQVCVDFIFDTWERAFGTWYTDRYSFPHRTEGDIDFSVLSGFSRRHIASILTSTLSGNTPFLRYDIPQKNWIPLEKKHRFIKNLVKISEHFRTGDLLIIHGLRNKDEQEHFHTVLILSMDPITGIPIEVADNQGRPRISSLKSAMRAAPRRSIKYRLRLDFEKAISITQTERLRKDSIDNTL